MRRVTGEQISFSTSHVEIARLLSGGRGGGRGHLSMIFIIVKVVTFPSGYDSTNRAKTTVKAKSFYTSRDNPSPKYRARVSFKCVSSSFPVIVVSTSAVRQEVEKVMYQTWFHVMRPT
jgi:hypothetical protein